MPFVVGLSSEDVTLASVGGKGWNLSRLSRAGFPVPPAFLITTEAYRVFVDHHRLQSHIASIVRGATPTDSRSLDVASAEIRALFEAGDMPAEVAEAICAGYRSIADPAAPNQVQGEKRRAPPVAIRSSATAEDLPGLSFAGQQDTFLNVIGESELLRSVKRCWASLWTARAIGYRARNQISPDGLELAVVVQQMIAAESSGVLFTANPLTGRRDETVIDASFGLGEAVVSGRVVPDHYVVYPHEGAIVSRKLGAKALAILPASGGGTTSVSDGTGDRQALQDQQILELAEMASRVATAFDEPQDIEWAWANGRLYLLQARPITTLYPLPDVPVAPGGTRVYISLNSFQGVGDPFTPLGSDGLQLMLGGFRQLFGVQREARELIPKAGMRLFLDVTDLVEDPRLRRLFRAVLSRGDPVAKSVLDALLSEGRLRSANILRRSQVVRLLSFALPTVARVVIAMGAPSRMRRWAVDAANRLIADESKRVDEALALSTLLAGMETDLGHGVRVVVSHFVPEIAASMILLSYVDKLLIRWAGASSGAVLELVRGLEGNVTMEMDLQLWDVARSVRADLQAARAIEALPPNVLAERFERGELPMALEAGVQRFLERYGMRTAAEIDLGRARWREDPTQLLGALRGYVGLTDQQLAPDVAFVNGARSSKQLAAGYVAIARKGFLGAVKAMLLGGAISRMRDLLSIREVPKLYLVKLLDIYRRGFLRQGDRLVALGRLEQADDIFFLSIETLKAVAGGDASDLKPLVAANRAEWGIERRRRQIPRVMLSGGETFYGRPMEGTEGDLKGEPVSPGVAEGKVRVVRDPRGATLEPGEILVCPATDPGWTPLFLTAGALVMEMGGLVTHGAVVAREYGIPAVVGVHEATTRLETGQRVRVDGTSGVVSRLE